MFPHVTLAQILLIYIRNLSFLWVQVRRASAEVHHSHRDYPAEAARFISDLAFVIWVTSKGQEAVGQHRVITMGRGCLWCSWTMRARYQSRMWGAGAGAGQSSWAAAQGSHYSLGVLALALLHTTVLGALHQLPRTVQSGPCKDMAKGGIGGFGWGAGLPAKIPERQLQHCESHYAECRQLNTDLTQHISALLVVSFSSQTPSQDRNTFMIKMGNIKSVDTLQLQVKLSERLFTVH